MMKIYLASPFFNEEENAWVENAEKILRNRGFDVYSPREHEVRDTDAVGTVKWANDTFFQDVHAIDESDCVVMLYHGNYSDSGTAWECGYAYAIDKEVICVQIGDVSNLMVHCSAIANITLEELKTYDFEEMPWIEYTGAMT
jgi:nucleoside 2-deoxyribosyltransferase